MPKCGGRASVGSVYSKAMAFLLSAGPWIRRPGLWESALGGGQAGGISAGLGMASGLSLNLQPEVWVRKSSSEPEVRGSWETLAGILIAPGAGQECFLPGVAAATHGTRASTFQAPSHTQGAMETKEVTLGEAGVGRGAPRCSPSPAALGSVI